MKIEDVSADASSIYVYLGRKDLYFGNSLFLRLGRRQATIPIKGM